MGEMIQVLIIYLSVNVDVDRSMPLTRSLAS